MLFPRWPLLLVSLLAPSILALRAAEACSPPSGGLQQTIPADGSDLPANSAIVFIGYNLAFTAVKASVPAMPDQAFGLVAAQTKFPALFASDAIPVFGSVYLVDPPPPAGQTVAIEGNFCGGSSPSFCDKKVSYTALPPDTTAPAAPTEVFYNRHDYPDFKSSGGDCQSNSDLAYWVHIKGAAAAAGEAAVIYRIEGFADATLSVPVLGSLVLAQGEETTVGYRVLASQLGGSSTADICLRVTTFDAAGNVSPEVFLGCKPCHARTDPPPGTKDFSAPPEPDWTPADLVPGGSCSAGGQAGSGQGGTTGGGASGDGGTSGGLGGGGPAVSPVSPDNGSGCGCRAAGSPPAALGGLVTLLGALAARLRRVRPGAE
jgi:uncharacterized membrane protein YgcG